MVIVCAAPGCSRKKDNVTTRGSSVQFHRFPLRKPDLLAKWVKAMDVKNFKPNVHSYLCNAHFKESDYDLKPTNAGKHLKPDAVPIITPSKRLRKPRNVRTKKAESDSDSKGEPEQIDNRDEDTVEYLEIVTAKVMDGDVKSHLAGILENENKSELQVLFVGEDGSITNSDFVLKKENSEEEDEKPDDLNEESMQQKDEFILMKSEEVDDKSLVHNIKSEQLSDLWYGNMKSELQIKELEEKLLASRKRVRLTEMKCVKLEKQLAELKTLLKLLVLKRGRGEKNLSELLAEYGSQENVGAVEIQFGNDEE